MIFAEWKPLDELVDKLKAHKKVLLVGCATCVAECAAGGEKETETLAPLLTMALKKQGHTVDITTATLEKQCEWEFVEELAEKAANVDAIMSLACGIGIQALAERFDPMPVYPGVNTSSLTIREEDGVWAGRCAACGDCVLDQTFGFCPIARCAKSLLNGPCGGTRKDGKCEVNEDVDCIWNLIVERAEQRGQLESLAEIRKTKNWSNSRHGGPKKVVREDLKK
ncbi:MAG: methylenetetrahydrofolate reductase C-terminal domain-containing protein [Sedimentisphaerales bacterium]|nr:methylenetetrahydrofolate reductase C-terminal domain-containing protein [Sedimentisphaerales bacterium]